MASRIPQSKPKKEKLTFVLKSAILGSMNEFPTPEEFREYAKTVFPNRVDRMWDNVDDWIKYGDMFINLRFPDKSEIKSLVKYVGENDQL